MKVQKLKALLVMAVVSLILTSGTITSHAGSAQIDKSVDEAMGKLFKSSPVAKELASVAKGMLIFPDVVKAGIILGAQFGEGALRKNNATVGYYNTVAASYGLQVGAQKFGYALYFMTDDALEYLEKSSGWEIGVGPSVVVVDAGMAKSLTTTTAKESIYAFFFDQKGLMAGLGLQGSKITKFNPDKK